MKAMLVIMLLFHFSTYAREYKQIRGECTIEVTESDMFNQEEDLPFLLKADFILSFDNKTNNLLGQKVLIRQMINATTPVDDEVLSKLKSVFKFQQEGQSVLYSFQVSTKKVSDILLYSGAYRSQGIEFQSFRYTAELGAFAKAQFHQPPHIEDGLSYHFYVGCEEDKKLNSREEECLVWIFRGAIKQCGLKK